MHWPVLARCAEGSGLPGRGAGIVREPSVKAVHPGLQDHGPIPDRRIVEMGFGMAETDFRSPRRFRPEI